MNENPETFSIEEMTSQDIDAVLAIHQECNLCDWTKEGYEGQLDSVESLALVAKINGQVVGFIVFILIPGEEIAELLNIGVLTNFRGHKLASQLLERSISEMEITDCRHILLEVRVSNDQAIKFYEKHSFYRVATRKMFYNAPSEDAYTMCRTLKKIT